MVIGYRLLVIEFAGDYTGHGRRRHSALSYVLDFYILRRGGGKERTPKGILANNERSEFVFIFTDVHI